MDQCVFVLHCLHMCVCIYMSYVYVYVLHIFHNIYNVQRKSSLLHLSGGHINVDFMFALFAQV